MTDDLRDVQRRNRALLYYVLAVFAVIGLAHEIALYLK